MPCHLHSLQCSYSGHLQLGTSTHTLHPCSRACLLRLRVWLARCRIRWTLVSRTCSSSSSSPWWLRCRGSRRVYTDIVALDSRFWGHAIIWAAWAEAAAAWAALWHIQHSLHRVFWPLLLSISGSSAASRVLPALAVLPTATSSTADGLSFLAIDAKGGDGLWSAWI